MPRPLFWVFRTRAVPSTLALVDATAAAALTALRAERTRVMTEIGYEGP